MKKYLLFLFEELGLPYISVEALKDTDMCKLTCQPLYAKIILTFYCYKINKDTYITPGDLGLSKTE